MLLRLIGLIISGAAVSLVWRHIDPFLDRLFRNPYYGALYLILFLFILFYIIFPLATWFIYKGSSENRATNYYLEVYSRNNMLYLSLLRIYRTFLTGELKVHGNTYKYERRGTFRYFGSWAGTSIIIDKGKNDFVKTAYLYDGWHATKGLNAQVSGICKYFIYLEGTGRGYYCDLDQPDPKKISLAVSRIRKRDLIHAISPKPLGLTRLRYLFSNFLIRDTAALLRLLNELSLNQWRANWVDQYVTDCVLGELSASARPNLPRPPTTSTETPVKS